MNSGLAAMGMIPDGRDCTYGRNSLALENGVRCVFVGRRGNGHADGVAWDLNDLWEGGWKRSGPFLVVIRVRLGQVGERGRLDVSQESSFLGLDGSIGA